MAAKRFPIACSLLSAFGVCALLLVVHRAGAGQTKREAAPRPSPTPRYQKVSAHVLLLSISGLGADLFTGPETGKPRIPVFRRMQREGASAVSLESVFPSLTAPALASVYTGRLPADHGIGADAPFDEQTGEAAQAPFASAKSIKGDPLWDHLQKAGLSVGAVAMPLTRESTIRTVLPAPSPEPRPDLSGIKDKALLAMLQKDAATAAVCRALLEGQTPNLLMTNLSSYGAAQRRFGIGSEEAGAVLEQLDRLTGQLLEAAQRSASSRDTIFVLFSEASAARVDREFRPNVPLAKKGWLKAGPNGSIASWDVVVQSFGGSAAVFVRNATDEKLLRDVEELFQQKFGEPDSPIWRIVNRRDAAKLGADPRPSLYLDAAPGYIISAHASGPAVSRTQDRAAAGYSPSRAEMRAALLLYGPGIKPGARVNYARLIDLAPTIARLLGVEMKTARGRVLAETLINP